MARVFFIDALALSRAESFGDADACQRLQQSLGLAQKMPFVLADDGAPVRAANRWLSQLPVLGCSSPRIWRAYALDYCAWHDFLTARGVAPLGASREDLAEHHAARRMGEGGEILAASSWNRHMSALDSFYAWTLDEELIERVPFTYRTVRFTMPDGSRGATRANLAKERTARPHATLSWLEADLLRMFLDVGLSGLLVDGAQDESFRGRNAARNRALAELLSTTGLRIQEASYIADVELPPVPARARAYVAWPLPERICKRAKKRTVLVPPPTLRTLHGYARLERADCVETSDWQPERPLWVTDLGPDTCRVTGRLRRWERLAVEDRERLALAGGGSPLLFVQSSGAPMVDWDAVFAAATARCRRFEPAFPKVTAHTLRHTFAVHMLRWLIEQVAERVSSKVAESGHDTWAPYWRSHDPLLTLRDLMGHSSVATTQVYLHAIDSVRLYAEVMDEIDDSETDSAA